MGTWEVLRFESADASGFSLTADVQPVFMTVAALSDGFYCEIFKFERLSVCGLHSFPEGVFFFL